MGCKTCRGGRAASAESTQTFVVTYPDGSTLEVVGEHAAKVAVTIDPKAKYAPR